jgi:hypothetical protein
MKTVLAHEKRETIAGFPFCSELNGSRKSRCGVSWR